ncbi:MAG: YdcF family protein [Enterobacterales bacterium]|nr:YdcF family protein [Enterobacterales bacterium]
MSIEPIISQLSDIFLFPPGSSFALLFIAWKLFKKYRRKAQILLAVAFIQLYSLSLPVVADYLESQLQTESALSPKQVKQLELDTSEDSLQPKRAIVVLSAGRRKIAAEYGDIDTVSSKTLQRLQYAAWLHQKTQLPLLVSGGSPQNDATAEGVLMNQTMLSAFNIAPKWIEAKSRNTFENAEFSAEILRQQNIKEILLVTHAVHMKRAAFAFEQQGVIVIPAPTVFTPSSSRWSDYFPSPLALYQSQQALHELVGRVWYSIRY